MRGIHKDKGDREDICKALYDKILLVLPNFLVLDLKWYGGNFNDWWFLKPFINKKIVQGFILVQ